MSITLGQACGYKRPIDQTEILSPYQHQILPEGYHWDKPDMIHWLETNGVPQWRKTVSCFHPIQNRCGECAVCGKRFIYEAYVEDVHKIKFSTTHLPLTYATNPLKNKFLKQTWNKMQEANSRQDYSRYPRDRFRIYKRALKAYGLQAT